MNTVHDVSVTEQSVSDANVITFSSKNAAGELVEMFRLDADGGFFVKGRYVESDKEVVDGFKAWLREAGVLK